MDIDAIPQRKVHHGQNVKRLREILNIKQDALAKKMGQSQQTLSRYETMEKLDDELLEKIAKELNIPVEAIENFTEEGALNFVSNTFQEASIGNDITHYKCTFNPIEKVVELYERIIKEKEEKIVLLEQMLKEKG
ncbi:MAG: helix-turn-helix domain-containing protein [Candidatus Symbiothrix sp.]|jgi:transcriptional regulator with XRE-family HTH domain|nr:helix-turn-helix domain-containing protein [Candidatus Symbiothrix sp.]